MLLYDFISTIVACFCNLARCIRGAMSEQMEHAVQDSICRIIVERLGSSAWELESSLGSPEASAPDPARSLMQSVMNIKQAVRRSRSVAMISFPAGTLHHMAHLIPTSMRPHLQGECPYWDSSGFRYDIVIRRMEPCRILPQQYLVAVRWEKTARNANGC